MMRAVARMRSGTFLAVPWTTRPALLLASVFEVLREANALGNTTYPAGVSHVGSILFSSIRVKMGRGWLCGLRHRDSAGHEIVFGFTGPPGIILS
jgi:hypothetical protein